MIKHLATNGPPTISLAPMAGITDLPFRNLVARFGADWVTSEMVASQEVIQSKPGVRARAELGAGQQKTAVQLAGRDPYWMAEAAKYVAGQGAQIIDLNMGCPAKKVVGGLSGSALMRDLDHALSLIEAVVSAVDIPVTLKTRLGWDEDLRNAAKLAKRAEAAGICRIVIHGRTRCQFYNGKADWLAIGEVVEAVQVPVIANGDIVDVETARTALELSKAAGIMIGRGAQGRPWLLAQIAHELFGGAAPTIPCGEALTDMVANHYRDVLQFYGDDLGVRVARKHLGWYMDEARTQPGLRRQLLTSRDPRVVESLLSRAFEGTETMAA